jgi:hypothetical protein
MRSYPWCLVPSCIQHLFFIHGQCICMTTDYFFPGYMDLTQLFLFMYYLILIVRFKSTGVLVATMIVGCQSTISYFLYKNNRTCCFITISCNNYQNPSLKKYQILLTRMVSTKEASTMENSNKAFKKMVPRNPFMTLTNLSFAGASKMEKIFPRFYSDQKKCLKTKEGKTICMKLFLRGFCDKSCPHVHKLSPDDENAFYKFVIDCRTANEGALKPDF